MATLQPPNMYDCMRHVHLTMMCETYTSYTCCIVRTYIRPPDNVIFGRQYAASDRLIDVVRTFIRSFDRLTIL
jgi:hypothetical protein